MDHIDPICIFDTREYTGLPDAEPCPRSIDVPGIIKELDGLYARGLEHEAQGFLEDKLLSARSMGDWRGELSMLSELLGQYRRSMDEEKGLAAIGDALALIRAHRMGSTLSGATVMLNAATTLKCFGRAAESIPIFCHVSRVYSDKLDPSDYRFPGLYNNMALRLAGKSPWFGFAALWGRKLERDLKVSPVSSSWAPPKRTKVTNLGPLLEKDAILLNPEFLNLIGDTTSHAPLDTDISLSMETCR